jgi:hypothetical protein
LISALVMLHNTQAQNKAAAEQYFSFSSQKLIQPCLVINYQSAKGMYTEARFQYETDGSFSLNAGKTFSTNGTFKTKFQPMLGLVMGSYEGVNLCLNTEMEWKQSFFSAKTQYTHSFKHDSDNFFYSWFEGGYSLSKNFYAGLSSQLTVLNKQGSVINNGFFVGFTIGNLDFPVYFFDPFTSRATVVTAIVLNIQFRKK